MSHDHSHDQQPAQDPRTLPMVVKIMKMLMFISVSILVLLNLVIYNHHPHFDLEKLPGFWAFFGLVVAVVLGKVAKGAAHTFLGKDEDYYEKRG